MVDSQLSSEEVAALFGVKVKAEGRQKTDALKQSLRDEKTASHIPSGEDRLRYDGLYRATNSALGSADYSAYLRFYPDGEVIKVSSTGKPEDLRKWFSKEHAGVSRGTVIIQGNRVSFSAVSTEGVVDYTGEIEGDRIRLDSFSRINQNRSSEIYVFVKW
jgi:hypothetical protein